MGDIENNKIEDIIDAENQVKVYTTEEADLIINKKKDIKVEFVNIIGDIKVHEICVNIDKIFFSELPEEEIGKHIFHHVLASSSVVGSDKECVYDKKDRGAEEALNQELKKAKAKKLEKNN